MRHTNGGNAFLNGEIEEARLYDFALSTEQVRASFKAGVDCITTEELREVMSEADRAIHRSAESELANSMPSSANCAQADSDLRRQPEAAGPTLLLKRGDFEKPGEAVTPGSPASVKGPPPSICPRTRLRPSAGWRSRTGSCIRTTLCPGA